MPQGIYTKVVCPTEEHPEFVPQKHQKEVLNYFLNKSTHKGLLLFHRLGSGKSCSSIIISDEMIAASKAKKVFVMTPGSLRENFIEEYCMRCGKSAKDLKKYYTFITTNYAVGEKLPNLDNSIVIIDEVHNLINGVKNQSYHSTLIYKKLLESNCRILALTGTPIYNYIWEWPFLGNLLKPGTFPNLINKGVVESEAFMKQFDIDENGTVTPKNKKMFDIELRGIISYFPGVSGGFYPEVIHEKPIKVLMTRLQDNNYWQLASWESDTRLKGPPSKSMMKNDMKKYDRKLREYIMASKYILTRSGLNFYYPLEYRQSDSSKNLDVVTHKANVTKYIYKPTGDISFKKNKFYKQIYNEKMEKAKERWPDKKEIEYSSKIKQKTLKEIEKNVTSEDFHEDVGWVNRKHFDNKQLIDIYSRKMTALLVNVVNNWKAKHVLFSFFKSKAGVDIIHALFKMCGIHTEVYSGDISDNKRKVILKRFNAEGNRYGDKIKMLLVTEAGAEGINIFEAQHMHILESSTREMKVQQAIGRVVRYKSHMVEGRKPMPKNEQVVHVWRYWSVSNPDPFIFKNKQGKEKIITNKTTVDELLYHKGMVFVNSIQSFLNILKNASVTSYDKKQDKEGALEDYRSVAINPSIEKACQISDERYIKNYGLKAYENAVQNENVEATLSSIDDDEIRDEDFSEDLE